MPECWQLPPQSDRVRVRVIPTQDGQVGIVTWVSRVVVAEFVPSGATATVLHQWCEVFAEGNVTCPGLRRQRLR